MFRIELQPVTYTIVGYLNVTGLPICLILDLLTGSGFTFNSRISQTVCSGSVMEKL